MKRSQIDQILADVKQKMVFIVGPRQVGKTWIAKEIAKQFSHPLYLNFDQLSDRTIIKNQSWLPNVDLIIFDELHKMKGWKNYLKGVYDTKTASQHILVTGSAGLHTHKKIGDSLAGRYFVHTIFPFSLHELQQIDYQDDAHLLEKLMTRGGFPEPFLAANDVDASRWRALYIESLLRTDVLDFARIEDLKAMTEIFTLLRHSVSSAISYSSLARNLNISPLTVKKYLGILESLFLIFTIRPYTHKISRAILKEPKVYFFDNGLVAGDSGAQLENFVAISLYKDVQNRNELTGETNHLAYIKNKENKEVDFVVIDSHNTIVKLIEVKTSDAKLSANIQYFQNKLAVPAVQVVQHLRHGVQINPLTSIVKADQFLQNSVFDH